MTCVVPDVGQLVEVRSRRCIVTDVIPDAIAHKSGAYSGDTIVQLQGIEDDALGDELEVVWQIEPGTRILDRSSLPQSTGFDEPKLLDALLDAVRWRTVATADRNTVQAPFRAGIDIEDFQLEPLVRALDMPRVNLLIADDVGLGKTIEAGLVMLELMIRARANRVLVVCPAGLQLKWQEEMQEKFGLEFRIVDTALMKKLRRERGRGANPWRHHPRLITSMDYLKRDRPLARFRETLPAPGESIHPRRYDILILDEAQNVAPSGRGDYALDSQRTAAMREIVPHFEHRLFLSATPHNGYPESFAALLELLDDQRFARDTEVDPIQLKRIMVRRLKGDIPPGPDGKRRFPERILRSIEVDYDDAERTAFRNLVKYTKLRRERAASASERFATEFVLKILKKRLFSSPAAFAATLAVHRETAKRGGCRSQPAMVSSRKHLERSFERMDEDYANDEVFAETEANALTAAAQSMSKTAPAETVLLDSLESWAERATASGDTKLDRLVEWIERTLRTDDEWNDRRVVVFTEYRTTQLWLLEKLVGRRLGTGDRIECIYGGMKGEERERIKAHFQKDPSITPVRILLATECASEGIDLQNHCDNLIHYEIPWNPNRLEQRNGRIDRRGQPSPEVFIHHFVGAGFDDRSESVTTASEANELEDDLEFLARAAIKLETIRESLGRVGTVLAAKVQRAMIGEVATLDASIDEGPEQTLLAAEKKLRERVRVLRERLEETRRDLRLKPDHVRRVVEIALNMARKPRLEPCTLMGAPEDGFVFRMPPLDGTWSRCMRGLEDSVTHEIRPCTFDHDVANGRDDVVLVHLEHPLVKNAVALLRAEVWAPEASKRMHRITTRTVPAELLDGPAAIVHGRFTVVGEGRHRLHEELLTAGGTAAAGRWERFTQEKMEELLGAAGDPPAEASHPELLRWIADVEPQLLTAIEARMRDRAGQVAKALEKKRDRELKDIAEILTELQATIERELSEADKSEQMTFEGWDDDRRAQFRRNVDVIRRRLERIPAELAEEQDRIRARYAEQTPRSFPLAITVLVPEGS
jgi:helicase-like protein/SNF2 domain-containing protein